jgi:hypothetical protein
LPDTDARAFDVVSAPLGTSGPEFHRPPRWVLARHASTLPGRRRSFAGRVVVAKRAGEAGSGFVDRAGDKSGGADAGAAGLRRWNEGATLKLF